MESEPKPKLQLDFDNTEIAFSNKTDKELVKMARLFKLMNNNSLVNVLSSVGLLAVKWKIPFSKYAVKQTIYEQFVGGEHLLDCQATIEKLHKFNTMTILDYGAEGKSNEEELNFVAQETIRALEFAASNNSVPCVSTKITGLVDNEVLIKLGDNQALTEGEQHQYQKLEERVHAICSRAQELGVAVLVDAEETWIQDPIDDLVDQMMAQYNKEQVVIYNTFQMYRSDRLQFLKDSHQKAKDGQYLLGAKLVRGAYMDKERERAELKNYPSPINPTKDATDKMYNTALQYCVDHYEEIAFCNATHNRDSNALLAQVIVDRNLDKAHPHLNFCQLYGMSDNITFNLADEGFNVAKYMPYGPVEDVVPYLIRRAQENSSVTGEMSRELSLIHEEKKRRGL